MNSLQEGFVNKRINLADRCVPWRAQIAPKTESRPVKGGSLVRLSVAQLEAVCEGSSNVPIGSFVVDLEIDSG